MTFDHVFDKVIFDVLISFLTIFNVVMVYKFFDVLFAFHCCDFRSSDPFPLFQSKTKLIRLTQFTGCVLLDYLDIE
jgi:hypothetical protein